MSNVLKVNEQEAINNLFQRGWSQRRIAQELGLNRRTVKRYASKCTTQVTPGAEGQSKCTGEVTPGGDGGQKSRCGRFSTVIKEKAEEGLSAQRIYQDLVEEIGFEASYQSVKRYVRKLKASHPGRVWRMECQPGEEMQVDFGLGAPLEADGNKTRRSWVLRVVLSYSRKGYSEAVLRQDTESFLRALENAVRHFGGSPRLVNVDNLKAAVLKADWFDPEINPKLAEFCRHYGMHVLPCRPRIPRHKGKVERGVGYVRSNALKGRRFASLAEENLHLARWEENVADRRIHGTTRRQVATLFEAERPHLQPLPSSLFPCYQEARRSVHRDSYVEVAKAFYEVPPEYIGREVWVRWDNRVVRVFNQRLELVQTHRRLEPGSFSKRLGVVGLNGPLLRSCRWWISQAGLLGPSCRAWAQSGFDARGPEALRAIMGLCNLGKKHSDGAIDAACATALAAGAHRLKDIRRLLDTPPGTLQRQQTLDFQENHPLIRDLKTYSQFIDHNQNYP